jgi:hypothetical protein
MLFVIYADQLFTDNDPDPQLVYGCMLISFHGQVRAG